MGDAGNLPPERRQLIFAMRGRDVAAALRAAHKLAAEGTLTLEDAVWILRGLHDAEEDAIASRWSARLLARLILGTPGITLEGVDELRRTVDLLPDADAEQQLRRAARTIDAQRPRRPTAPRRPVDRWPTGPPTAPLLPPD